MCFGKEVGQSGTPHLQGIVIFKNRRHMTGAKKFVGGNRPHVEPTRNNENAMRYCQKDDDFTTYGSIPGPGRNEEASGAKDTENELSLEPVKAAIKEGVTDLSVLRERFSEQCARFMTFINEFIEDCREPSEVECFPLREWQSKLNEKLNQPATNREIIFVVDKVGNQGKTWFASYYQSLHGGDKKNGSVQILHPGKRADMAHVCQEKKRVYFLDCCRSKQGQFIQYDFLEELKNGKVFSPKYDSKDKITKPEPKRKAHVVVLLNEHPDKEKLSADRYTIIELT